MTGGVRGERRREVGSGQIACRRAQRHEGGVGDRRPIAIARKRQRRVGIGLADSGDRPPELVVVLRLPDRDAGVGHRRVDQRQQAGERDDVRVHLVGDLHRDLVVEARRRAQARRPVVGPEDSDLGLLRGAARRRHDAVAAERLHFGERTRIRGRSQRGRRGRAKLRAAGHHERRHFVPVRPERNRHPAYRILAPLAGSGSRDEFDADARLGMGRAVVRAQAQDRRRRAMPEVDSEFLRSPQRRWRRDRARVARRRRPSATETGRRACRAPLARWRLPSTCCVAAAGSPL